MIKIDTCVLKYCNATVADFDEMAQVCQCLNCFGKNLESCPHMKGNQLCTSLLEQHCIKCKFGAKR